MSRRTLEQRFWEKVEKTDTCWLWTGWGVRHNGYGLIWVADRRPTQQQAHRISYELHKGPIPAGLQIDHLCRNPACVNPDHLEPVTQSENVRRGLRGPREFCPRGHAYAEHGRRRADTKTMRCLECHRISERARTRRKTGQRA